MDGGQIYWLVNSVMIRDCEYYKDNWAFEPIPLTHDILEKTNLIPDNYGIYYFRKDGIKKSESGMKIEFLVKFVLVGDTELLEFCVGSSIQDAKHIRYIEHLHTLQNVIFFNSETKQELEYKP